MQIVVTYVTPTRRVAFLLKGLSTQSNACVHHGWGKPLAPPESIEVSCKQCHLGVLHRKGHPLQQLSTLAKRGGGPERHPPNYNVYNRAYGAGLS